MTERFSICRRIEIDAAHRVPHHRSKCYAIHGHRYVIEAELTGPLFAAGEQRGMVMDFGFVKELMLAEIHEPCDHGLILWEGDDDVIVQLGMPSFADRMRDAVTDPPRWLKLYLLSVVPTAENLAAHWFERLAGALDTYSLEPIYDPARPRLEAVHVHETPNCVATYRPGAQT